MRKGVKRIGCILLAAGLAVLLYPQVQQWIFDQKARSIARDFDQRREELGEETEGERGPYLAELYQAMQAYNQDLYENGQAGFRDAWSYQSPSFDLTQWGLADNMVGYIDIPKMGIELPIYLGASTENMRKGAVHLSQTSLPIGGENSNSVIAGHRGSIVGAMFRDIEKLEIGDEITITNLWETLTYQVDRIRIIRPDDTQEVLIQEGRDLVTLITCHPYGRSDQRYVVYCKRVV